MQKRYGVAQIYEQYFPEIYQLVNDLVNNKIVALDIIANVFIALHRKLNTDIKGDKNIKAFLYKTARDTSLSHLKRQQSGTSQITFSV